MIFNDIRHRIRFCFNFDHMKPEQGSETIRVIGSIGDLTYGVVANKTAALAADARAVIDEVASLQGHEQAALVATFSHDWSARRGACDVMRDYFRPLMARVIDDRHLLSKLVTRHYIAERDRGSGWSLAEMAQEFTIELERLRRAADLLDIHAKALERAALQSLEARLQLLEPEAAHG